MDVCAFVGLTQRGPVGEAVPVTSWEHFRAVFGEPGGGRLLPDAVSQFFANGGTRCVVVRHLVATELLSFALAGFQVGPSIVAAHPGSWLAGAAAVVRFETFPIAGDLAWSGADVHCVGPAPERHATLRIVSDSGDQTLHRVTGVESAGAGTVVSLDPPPPLGSLAAVRDVRFHLQLRMPGAPTREYKNLALHEDHPQHPAQILATDPDVRWAGPAQLLPAADGRRRVATAAFPSVPTFSSGELTTAEGADLIERDQFVEHFRALDHHDQHHRATPCSFVHLPDLVHLDAVFTEGPDTQIEVPVSASTTFQDCEDIPLHTLPQRAAVYPKLHVDHLSESIRDEQLRAVRALAASRRMILLDVPPHLDADQVPAWRAAFDSSRAVAYTPWLFVARASDQQPQAFPPGGVMAGSWASFARSAGVGRAPANGRLDGTIKPADEHQLLSAERAYALHINRIEHTSRGYLCLGSRTLSAERQWAQINARRTVDWLALQLPVDHQWAVFEPNNRHLARRVGVGIRRRLNSLFGAQALAGETPESSYFYELAPQPDSGVFLARIGIAPSHPMEFLIVELRVDSTAGRAEASDE